MGKWVFYSVWCMFIILYNKKHKNKFKTCLVYIWLLQSKVIFNRRKTQMLEGIFLSHFTSHTFSLSNVHSSNNKSFAVLPRGGGGGFGRDHILTHFYVFALLLLVWKILPSFFTLITESPVLGISAPPLSSKNEKHTSIIDLNMLCNWLLPYIPSQ